ncbi:hypothetical protein GTQ40_11755 [Flavobacteriaceae bacterium R38]|nr:hypothetical protein [Flavobacteriaceae bacterium R38]
MLKNILDLGKALDKAEQKKIMGGLGGGPGGGVTCFSNLTLCLSAINDQNIQAFCAPCSLVPDGFTIVEF